MKRIKFLKLISDLYCRIDDDDISALGAQMAYYLLLAFFPFIIFLANLISFVPITWEDVIVSLKQYLPYEAWDLVSSIGLKIYEDKNSSLLSFSVAGALWAASNGVNALIRGLNKAYNEEETRCFWKVRLISLLFTLGLSIIILFSIVMLVFGQVLSKNLFNHVGLPQFFQLFWHFIRYSVPIGVMITIFTLLYYYTPNRRLSFVEVLPGAVLSTIGWIIISTVFSIYVNNFSKYSKMYGSIGGVIILLIWIYLSGFIILVGGEFNASLVFYRKNLEKPDCKKFSIGFLRKKHKK